MNYRTKRNSTVNSNKDNSLRTYTSKTNGKDELWCVFLMIFKYVVCLFSVDVYQQLVYTYQSGFIYADEQGHDTNTYYRTQTDDNTA